MENDTEMATEVHTILFSWYDYTLFGVSLSLSALTGVYFGFIKKQSTANEYLLGGKQMKVLPISMSLISSSISGIIVLSLPVEIYRFGVTYWVGNLTIMLAVLTSACTYIPVFYKLQITSIYEYFQLRFDSRTRLLSSFLFASVALVYLPIVIYVPALALSQGECRTRYNILSRPQPQLMAYVELPPSSRLALSLGFSWMGKNHFFSVSGFDTHLITLVVCGICIFYTTIGGLKAVVWSDALQFFIMIGGMVAVLVMGVLNEGGFEKIWAKSQEGRRLDVDFGFDFTKRDTIWTATLGVFTMFLGYIGTNQGFMQKCMALPVYSDVQKALWLFAIGIVFILSTCSFTGLIMFAKYFDCDPLSSGKIDQPDQLLPYYIMEVGHSIPGLPGLFIAGIFSAALSTLSAVMNCVAGVIYEDFISRFTPKDISQERVSFILKVTVVIIGVISTSLIYVIENLGGVLPLAFGMPGVTNGPLLGLFTVGMLVPAVNAKGAFYGGVVSLITMAWIIFGSQWYQSQGLIRYPTLPLSTEGCANFTITDTFQNSTNYDEPFFIYRISFYYYYLVAITIVLVVSLPISLLSKSKDYVVNKDCIIPFMHFLLPKDRTNPPDYYSIEKALNNVQN